MKFPMNMVPSFQQGYIALIGVLLTGALMLIAGLSASYVGIDAGEESLAAEFSTHARLLADACAEDAILKLKGDFNYAGGESIIVEGSETCMIVSISGIGSTDRIITAEAQVSGYTKRVSVDIERLTPSLIIRSWEETSS